MTDSRDMAAGGRADVCPECGGVLGDKVCSGCGRTADELRRSADANPAPVAAAAPQHNDDSQFGGGLEHTSRADDLIRSVLHERHAGAI